MVFPIDEYKRYKSEKGLVLFILKHCRFILLRNVKHKKNDKVYVLKGGMTAGFLHTILAAQWSKCANVKKQTLIWNRTLKQKDYSQKTLK